MVSGVAKGDHCLILLMFCLREVKSRMEREVPGESKSSGCARTAKPGQKDAGPDGVANLGRVWSSCSQEQESFPLLRPEHL